MKQISLRNVAFERKKRLTKSEVFLAAMEQVMRWGRSLAVVGVCYPKGKRGSPPVGLERVLRVGCVQVIYNLSDRGVEDTITDPQALRASVGVDLSWEAASRRD